MMKSKRQKIIDVAIKRFIYFGIAKTTMEDIAKDLALSKPSLYYYFVNKNHLVGAVLDCIFDEFYELLSAVSLNQTIEKILDEILLLQWTLFKRYYQLGVTAGLFFNLRDKTLKAKLSEFRLRNQDFLIAVFQESKQRFEIDTANVNAQATLYFQCLEGLLVNLLQDRQMAADQHAYQLVYKNARAFTAIFVKGIRSAATSIKKV